MNKEKISKPIFDQLGTLLHDAIEQGAEGIVEHFKAIAYGLGAQMAVTSNPEHMPEFINEVITEFGRGIQVGMQTAHGLNGRLNVQVRSVTKDRFRG